MKQDINLYNEEINNTSKPSISALLKSLKMAISTQKEESSKL